MRLIDADALCEYANNQIDKTVDANDIMRFPRVDAVPVVRCGDCAHCDDKTPYELWCLGRGWPNQMVPPDGYCDKGKRREAAR